MRHKLLGFLLQVHTHVPCICLERFTGWVDVPLSEKGVKEAEAAGKFIKEAGLEFDIAYTSTLKVRIVSHDDC